MALPEALVVGAGPAGSVTAILLARAGVRVRLVDRSTFPRDKLCGDTLNPGALALLQRLGVDAVIRRIALPVRGMVVTGPREARVVGDYGPGIRGMALTRRDLDTALLEEAVRAGARFDDGVTVAHPLTEGRRVTGVRLRSASGEEEAPASIVIAADGRHSRLAFGLGLSAFAVRPRRWAFGAYYTGVTGLSDYGEMHIRPDGYIGVAPVPGGLANVCVVRERREGTGDELRGDVIGDALAADEMLRDRFRGAARTSSVTTLGPLAVESRAAGVPGLLLAGDAAGFIDPMTGDGLRFAIRGAELAAAAALRELHTGIAAHGSLETARRREFSAKWRMNRLLRGLVASPAGVRAASAITQWWSAPVHALVAFAGDVHQMDACSPSPSH